MFKQPDPVQDLASLLHGADFDIGLCAEDAEAHRVVALAAELGLRPSFRRPKGPFLEVVFLPVLCPSSNNFNSEGGESEAVGSSSTPVPVLYGWVERLCIDNLIQIAEEVLPEEEEELGDEMDAAGDAGFGECQQQQKMKKMKKKESSLEHGEETREETVMQCRITEELSFLLHLWSTPHTERALTGTLTSASSPADVPKSRGSSPLPLTAEEAAFQAEVERRSDTVLVQNAIDTVIQYAKAIESNPNGKEVVYGEESGGTEYIAFV